MRILHVVHDFLPNHVAGVEVYTDQLARRQAEEHEVALLYTEVAPSEPSYHLRRGARGKLRTYEIVNNHTFRSFKETWDNPAVDRRVREVLGEFRPDVVHVQHLLNLSLGVVEEARRRRIPVVMTLHDHWVACANGGQRFHKELGRCERLDADRCGTCTAHMKGAGLGLLAKPAGRAGRRPGDLDLTRVEPACIEAPDRSLVYRDRYAWGGDLRPTWVAHPPASLSFALRYSARGVFRAAVAMHPSTFAAGGGAVRFRVDVDGEPRFERVLDAKRCEADRDPVALEVPIEAVCRRLQLITEAVPADRPEFCTAGWIAPRVGFDPEAPSFERSPLVGRLVRSLASLPAQAQARRVRRRWEAMRQLGSQVDIFLAPSRYLREECIGFGLPADRILYCDYGFAVEEFEKRRDLPEHARRFAFVGSLVRHKGVHVLLAAFDRMPEDATLDVYGFPSYDPSYSSSLASISAHPGIRLRGGLAPERVPAALRDADCLVVPSLWEENSPLTVHEAFLAGVPVVASRRGGHVELLAGGGGLLYDSDDSGSLCAALLRLYGEAGLARRLVASAARVKPMQEHSKELVELYQALLRGRRPDAA